MSNGMKRLDEMDYGELTYHVTEAIQELRVRAYGVGYEQAKFDAQMDEVAEIVNGDIPRKLGREFLEESRSKTDQEIRNDVVAQAKADVDNWGYVVYDYVVNTGKRTVVALERDSNSDKVIAKGIAKCDPSDCFNVHIGKAIALRRALGLVVPDEYLFGPNPTEVRVGDVVYNPEWIYTRPYVVASIIGEKAYDTDDSYGHIPQLVIIDDSRDNGGDSE